MEEAMAPHSSTLAWRIPGTGEPGGLLSMGSQRVEHDWSDLAAAVLINYFWGGEKKMLKEAQRRTSIIIEYSIHLRKTIWTKYGWFTAAVAAAAAKSLQSCSTLCDPIDGSPPGSPVPGILQGWVAISFSNAWKWKWKWSCSVVSESSQPHGLQPTRLLHPWDFPGKSTGVGCHCLLRFLSNRHLDLKDLDGIPLYVKIKKRY